MKTRGVWMSAVTLGVVFGSALASEDFKANCLISGKPADKSISADYLGKKVYFCCEGCPDAFKKDPAKFTAKANHQLLQTKQLKQVGCPFSGNAVNPATKVDFEGADVAFCCNNCKGKFEAADADKKLSIAFASLKKGFTNQTTCPVSGKPIDVKVSSETDGRKVYFCCAGCPDAFKKDPEKFASKLPPAVK